MTATIQTDLSRPTIVARRRPRPWVWVANAVVAVLVVMLAHALLANPNFQWGVVGQYFMSSSILQGLLKTLLLTVLSMIIGIVLGTLLAVMKRADTPVIAGAATLYIWFFRGTPLLVQLIFWYNLSSLYAHLSLGVPFGPAFSSASTNSLISPFTAALLGLGLNQAAYTAEIVRAGILSVPRGQLPSTPQRRWVWRAR
jgi:polar amino acid transport system permease protein